MHIIYLLLLPYLLSFIKIAIYVLVIVFAFIYTIFNWLRTHICMLNKNTQTVEKVQGQEKPATRSSDIN